MGNSDRSLLQQFFKDNARIRYVRFQWTDYSGVLHCRLVSKAKSLQMAEGGSPFKGPVTSMITPLATAPRCDVSLPQVWEFHPAWDTVRICGYAPAHASIECFLTRAGAEEPFSMCPRKLLTNTVKRLQEEHDAKVLIGFEIEFVLLDENLRVPESLDPILGSSMPAGIRSVKSLTIIEEVFDALELSNISVHHMHTEGSGQLEFSLDPLEPLEAVDALMLAQETIRTIALRHGLKATMTPKPLLQRFPTTGLHTHISIRPANLGDGFLAGILKKLRALCAFGLPSYDSYHRVEHDGTGIWVGWGTENRDLPLRAIEPAHWEFRPVDTTANFYLLLAALIAAGSAGLKQNLPLTWKDCRMFPMFLKPENLGSYGIQHNMPKSLKEAVDFLKAENDIAQWVGKELVENYVQVKEKEIEVLSEMGDEERRKRLLAFF